MSDKYIFFSRRYRGRGTECDLLPSSTVYSPQTIQPFQTVLDTSGNKTVYYHGDVIILV